MVNGDVAGKQFNSWLDRKNRLTMIEIIPKHKNDKMKL